MKMILLWLAQRWSFTVVFVVIDKNSSRVLATSSTSHVLWRNSLLVKNIGSLQIGVLSINVVWFKLACWSLISALFANESATLPLTCYVRALTSMCWATALTFRASRCVFDSFRDLASFLPVIASVLTLYFGLQVLTITSSLIVSYWAISNFRRSCTFRLVWRLL